MRENEAKNNALIWYLLLKVKNLRAWGVHPGKKDLIPFFIALPCLLITGFVVSFVSVHFGGVSAQIPLRSPDTVIGWAVLSFSCLAAAYLEESFFRFFILSRRKELKLKASGALLLSVALFSVCHIYEGPWGFLNSVISGIILCFIFLRYKSLHGIAIAHTLYNITAYAINALLG